jgi:hypothetical protein
VSLSWADGALAVLDRHIAQAAAGRGGIDPAGPDVFREEPVPLNAFITDSKYLHASPLSDEQFRLVALAETIYFPQTYGILDWSYTAEKWWRPGYTELSAEWGKGSGKDYCARCIIARAAYLLLCLKEPHLYYNHDVASSIDLLNVARSTQQANDVFFVPLTRSIGHSPWFSDKADVRVRKIHFDNQIVAHSGHADQESLEGFNLMIGVADEIAAFKTKEELRGRSTPRSAQHDAEAVDNMMRSSGQSRFPGLAKVIKISYPRFRGDYIEQSFAKSLVEPTHYGTKKATWEVNPTKTRQDFEEEFRKDPELAEAKYGCNPPAATNKFYRNDKAIDNAFSADLRSPVDDLGFLMPDVSFDHGKPCAIHMDLAAVNDRMAICMAHLQDWRIRTTTDGNVLRQPEIFVDVITSFSAYELGLSELPLGLAEDLVLAMIQRGARVRLITADQWQSRQTLQNLEARGYEIRQRSVDRDTSAHDTLKQAIYSSRLYSHVRQRAVDELKGLKLINGVKVDHEPGSSKDEADALAGAAAGVTEISWELIDTTVESDHVGWSDNNQSTWHDPYRGPHSQRANFDAVATSVRAVRGALRPPR